MRKSIKIMAGVRIVAALLAVVLFSLLTTRNIYRMEASEAANVSVNALLQTTQKAEAAHYKWSSNLNNALYSGTEFTGSTDPTGCVLGQWLYGEAGTEDQTILDLRSQLEPLHKQLHESAVYVLDFYETDPEAAQAYYQDTIMGNLSTLVGLLDQIVERGTALNEISTADMATTVKTMHVVTGVGLVLTLFFLLSLVFYIMHRVVKPILLITEKTMPLHDGRMKIELDYRNNDEIGDLAGTLKQAIGQIHRYIEDINRIMEELSAGNFNVSTSVAFVGDFKSIADSIDSFTNSLSGVMSNIHNVEDSVFDHARTLSNGSQSLAQGATEQAAAVEELSATLTELSRSAQQNLQKSSEVRENARQTGDQVNLSSAQMEQLISAMADISRTSEQIENIISTIENIAFQTNILALNASVEASRAGEAGKGFAVVANEVRNLAAKSDQAAKATKELIENSVRATTKGSAIVQEVSDTLHKTIRLVQQSNSAISDIADAVQEEAEAVSQVAEGIGQISTVVQSNSANSEESAAVSAELFEQVNQMKNQTRAFRLK
ncbi:MAG: methyl-accepting chemotaxis protein [Bacteroidales bacterium]|nr:methyl-accepting chemotaxis protein [Bacteroidales bacterium]MCM1416400.1 methyl-accepting chemotaxis protein [bacterium]MCM1424157.1 methyl-accepting chemotaxis protein [bacterium]